MSRRARQVIAVVALSAAGLAVAAPSSAAVRAGAPTSVHRAPAVTYTGAFEFEGIAGKKTGRFCRGSGVFGVAKPGAKVTISERNAAGDFSTLAKGKLAKGTFVTDAVTDTGGKVCRMAFRANAAVAPAGDSSVYLEVKGLAFNLQFPAADVADGDLGTWTCGSFDDGCARVVGG
jgi:hypothetical protein